VTEPAPTPGLVMMPLADLIPDPNPAKRHTKAQVKSIANSIREVGFIDPIEIGPENQIIRGNGAFQAAVLLEMEQVPCIVLDISGDLARSYAIAHNRLTLSTGFEIPKLADALAGLDLTKADQDLMGLSKAEVDTIEAAASLPTTAPSLVDQGEEAPERAQGGDQELAPAPAPTRIVRQSYGSAVVFDNPEQAERWERFLTTLAMTYPDAETVGARLTRYTQDSRFHGEQ
jgi:ParB-like chromosome segregation protein Spo0J